MAGRLSYGQDVIKLSPQTIEEISKQVPPGKDGATGMQGAQGIQGVQGPKGDKGDPGSGASKPSCVYYIYTAADWDSCIAGLKDGRVTAAYVMQTGIKKNVTIPKSWAGDSKFFYIQGNGAYHDGWIKQEKPASQSEAEDLMTQFKWKTENLAMQAPGDTCIVAYGGYGNSVVDCRFRKAKQAVYGGFTMNMLILHNDAVNMTGTGFEIDRLYVTGSGTSSTCSNNSMMALNRVFNANGSYASLSSKAANNVLYWRNILEGGSPQFGIITDDQGSTTCKQVLKIGNHFELTPGVADMQDRLNDGSSINDGNWFQKPSPKRLNVISGAGALITFNNHPNLLSGDKLSADPSCKWSMMNNKRFDFSTLFTAPPTQYDIKYFYQGGARWENLQGQLNGKKLTTTP